VAGNLHVWSGPLKSWVLITSDNLQPSCCPSLILRVQDPSIFLSSITGRVKHIQASSFHDSPADGEIVAFFTKRIIFRRGLFRGLWVWAQRFQLRERCLIISSDCQRRKWQCFVSCVSCCDQRRKAATLWFGQNALPCGNNAVCWGSSVHLFFERTDI
jgi:hypothetical protein